MYIYLISKIINGFEWPINVLVLLSSLEYILLQQRGNNVEELAAKMQPFYQILLLMKLQCPFLTLSVEWPVAGLVLALCIPLHLLSLVTAGLA